MLEKLLSTPTRGGSLAFDRRTFCAGLGAAAAVAAAPSVAHAQTLTPIRVGYFPGVSTLPLWAAIDQGYFTKQGLQVTATPTPASIPLFMKLDTGELELAHTSIDNPIAYDSGNGAAKLEHNDFVAFMGVDDGLLRLVARPGITKIADLRGKNVAVDALSTGYAFALRAILETVGLKDTDVNLVAKGGTQQRYELLAKGDFDATLLTPPFDVILAPQGYTTLAKATDVVGAYQGIAVVGRRAWLMEHRAIAVQYAKAFRAAMDHVATNKPESVALLVKYAQLTEPIASASYDAAFAKGSGLHRDASIDMPGVRTVLRLRAKYAPPGAGSDPERFVERTVLATAMR